MKDEILLAISKLPTVLNCTVTVETNSIKVMFPDGDELSFDDGIKILSSSNNATSLQIFNHILKLLAK